MQSKSEDISLKGVVAQQKSRDAARVQAAHPEFINYQRALAKQESRDAARMQAAYDEAGLNGRAIAWHYWVHLMPVLNAMQAACLMSALEPDVFANLNERPGKTDPAKNIEKAKKIQRLAEAQGKLTASPVEWVEWAQSQPVKVHPGFLLAVEELPEATGESSAPAAKGEAGTSPSGDDVEEQTPAADADDHNYSETLAALFDPVPVDVLEKMFPADGMWNVWAERAARNGLKYARQGRKMFNPYKAGMWFVTNGGKGLTIGHCRRMLANNHLPDRSMEKKYLLTGELD